METQGRSVPLKFTIGNVNVQIDPSYMDMERKRIASIKHFSLTFLLEQAQFIFDNLSAEGRQSLLQHTNQISYSFKHSPDKNPVNFLTKYFIEYPDFNEIKRKFFAVRWTEEFEAEDIHTAFLNAICIRSAIFDWDFESTTKH